MFSRKKRITYVADLYSSLFFFVLRCFYLYLYLWVILLARPASRCRRRADVLLMLLFLLNVASLIRQRLDASQRGLLR